MSVLESRREEVDSRLRELRAELPAAERLLRDKGCVYLTGSYGRGEASRHSDLDLFIAGKGLENDRALSNLDEILVKADLIEAARKLKFPEFSGDGEYLEHHAVDALINKLGGAQDDASNAFTARMLLLLESRPLLGEDVYSDAIDDVLAKYWRDYADHKGDFVPAFLGNDILRMWRTFCVNYEARTKTEPVEKKAKRKLKNYKLKHSRLLTCYSALAHLSAVFELQGTVSPEDAKTMVRLTPTKRLEWLSEQMATCGEPAARILDAYERFLEKTNAEEEELIALFLDPGFFRTCVEEAKALGDRMHDLLFAIGDHRFQRLLVV